MKKSVTIQITLKEGMNFDALYGSHDRHLRMLEKSFGVTIGGRGGNLMIAGDASAVQRTEKAIMDIATLSEEGFHLTSEDVTYAITAAKHETFSPLEQIYQKEAIPIYGKKRAIMPRSPAQQTYIEAIKHHDLVFGIGPAGTGKTYLAMTMAVSAFVNREVKRIVLARPAVEAGEKLGFLPGSMIEKVNPYLRPLYDALYDMMDIEKANRLLEHGDIEIVPLAFMRGRTLNDAFIILDEAQNTTSEQMKMFLTRMGLHSKAVITGDITQIDLPSTCTSGLIEIQNILKKISGIKFVYFSEKDVMRHSLVQEIIKAYQSRSGHVPCGTCSCATGKASKRKTD
jgi:phosphate starvation-inducible PhoH-like protein